MMGYLGLSSDPGSHQQPHTYPYHSSSASSASSSSSSVFSIDAVSVTSQSSVSSSISGRSALDGNWDHESGAYISSGSQSTISGVVCTSRPSDAPVSPHLRQNARRTSCPRSRAGPGHSNSARAPPTLVRQSERKVNFVDNLVDTATQIVEIIWPLSSVATKCDVAGTGKGVLPLRTFIQETLRRSRTSYSTLQVALYYLIKVKAHVPSCNFTQEQTQQSSAFRAMQCGRRMFLAALILASKYLQDRNYSARAWSKISGLNTAEINQNEISFLKAVSWELHIPEALFQRWTEIVLKYTPTVHGGASKALGYMVNSWKDIVPRLNDKLELESVFVPDRSESLSPPSVYQNYPPSPPWSDTSDDATPTLSEPSLPTPRAHDGGRTLPSLRTCVPRINVIATPPMSIPNTPAVSFGPARPAISSAMSQMHQASTHRSTLDPRPLQDRTSSYGSFPTAARRSSLARSVSSSSSFSSPESMVSDTSSLSSRSSRSSSISSIASSSCGSSQPSLAVLATRRCANMSSTGLRGYGRSNVTSFPIDEATIYSSPESFDGVTRLTDSPMEIVDPAKEAAQALISLPLARIADGNTSYQAATLPSYINRKRSRCNSVENWSLEQSVSDMLKQDYSADVVVADPHMATSFLLQPKEIQIPSSNFSGSVKLPVPLSMPRNSGSLKRACCEKGRPRTSRPGIPNGWENLLLTPGQPGSE